MTKKIIFTVFLSLLVSVAVCGQDTKSKPAIETDSTAILSKIDLTKITRFAPKGRVQNQNLIKVQLVDDLIKAGKPAVPWLIEQLEDETVIEQHVMDYWYNVSVGDVSLILLFNLFQGRDGKPTINGFGWDEFLERANENQTGEQVLRVYIEKNGRSKIKERWQQMWDQNKDSIFWDKETKSFRLNK